MPAPCAPAKAMFWPRCPRAWAAPATRPGRPPAEQHGRPARPQIVTGYEPNRRCGSPAPRYRACPSVPGSLGSLIDEIEEDGHGLVLCMGKGGVGKTTIAARIAVSLAHRGHPVNLTTTDPAAHLDETLHGTVDGLRVSRIDPVQATQEYRDRIMASRGKNLDEVGRANLAEDLLSPCTEEVAVFQQFSKAVYESRREFVVIDTAPTGHTLLLLDAAGSYHRDVVRQMGDSSTTRPH